MKRMRRHARPRSNLREIEEMSLITRIALLSLLTAAILPISVSHAEELGKQIEATRADLEAARSRNLALMCPSNFKNAETNLGAAEELFENNDSIYWIKERLGDARAQLSKCERIEEIGNILLRDTLSARSAALDSNAPEFAPEQWEQAEEAMHKVGRKIERGQGDRARDDAEEATDLYRAAELMAIRVDLLGRTKTLRGEALENDADRWAPRTLASAEDYLQQAESTLQSDRYRQGEAKSLAEAAAEQFKHATWISTTAQRVDDDRENFEQFVLEHEAALSEVAGQLGFTPRYSEGVTTVAENLASAARSLNENRRNLQARIMELEEVAAKYAEVQPLKQIQQKVNKIEEMFGPGEAEIVLSDRHLILRLTGMSFAFGSAEIQPRDFPLLTKVQYAMRLFPSSRAIIEGHSDSIGNADYNQVLSRRRAEAVRTYLIANMNRAPSSIAAVGYGENRPVAPNDTAAGRAMNRRIDVLIDLARSLSAGPVTRTGPDTTR
jgi:outer membrane protein OmpA-like peptidoglycan-associated protein